MKKIIFTLSTIVFIFSCNSEKQTDADVPVIDLAAGLKLTIPSMKSLNEISSGYEVIPLETSDECLLSGIGIKSVTDNSIWLLDNNEGGTKQVIYRFDKTNGSMLFKLDRKGPGPEEYNLIGGFMVDNKEHVIYVNTIFPSKFLKYNFDGIFLESIETNVNIGAIALFDENHYLINYGTTDSAFCAGIYDKQWNMIRQFLPRTAQQDKSTGVFYNDLMLQFNDKHYIKKFVNDTIYQIEEREVKPYLIISTGNLTMPVEVMIDNNKQQDFSKYIYAGGGLVVSDYYFTTFYYQNKTYQDIWDLKTTSLIFRKIVQQQQDGRYGYPFEIKEKTIYVSPTFVSDGTLYCIVSVEQMREVMPNIKEDDNPIIVAIKINNK